MKHCLPPEKRTQLYVMVIKHPGKHEPNLCAASKNNLPPEAGPKVARAQPAIK